MLSGYKTFIWGGITALVGVAKMVWPELPLEGDPGTLISLGIGLIFTRLGINKVT